MLPEEIEMLRIRREVMASENKAATLQKHADFVNKLCGTSLFTHVLCLSVLRAVCDEISEKDCPQC